MNKISSSAMLFALAVFSWPAVSQLGSVTGAVGGITDGALIPGAPIKGTLDANAKININTATKASLQKEFGLSEAQAAALIQHRQEKGPFTSSAELSKVEGLGAEATAKLKRGAAFDSEFATESSVGTSGAAVTGSASTSGASTSGGSNASTSAKLDLNTASQAALQSDLGLTRAEAAAVIRHREEKGAINSAAQLDAVSGLGAQGATKIRNGVAFGSQAAGTAAGAVAGAAASTASTASTAATAALVDINSASRSALQSGLGITKKQAKALINYREKNGPFTSAAQIDSVGGINQATADKIKAGARFDASASANTQSAR